MHYSGIVAHFDEVLDHCVLVGIQSLCSGCQHGLFVNGTFTLEIKASCKKLKNVFERNFSKSPEVNFFL